MPGTPEHQPTDFFPRDPPIQELFLFNGDQVLQLTKFDRVDGFGAVLDSDGQRVFFLASADPFGTNPSENCQVFSVGTGGGDLRQVTSFSASDHSVRGCFGASVYQAGCVILGEPFFDSRTQTLILTSDCNPLGTNPAGNQIFAMHPDGTGLRQLTATRGMVTAADGSVDVELPGPIEVRF